MIIEPDHATHRQEQSDRENHMLDTQIMSSLTDSIGGMSGILTHSTLDPELQRATKQTIMKMHDVLGEVLERLRTITIEK